MIEFIKKKWLLLIVLLIVLIVIGGIIYDHIEEKKLEDSLDGVGRGASDFIDGVYNNKNSHLNEFHYNSKTGEVDYIPNNSTSSK